LGCGSRSGPTFYPSADLDSDPDPSFQIEAQTLEKVLKKGSYFIISYILACHLQIDSDPDLVPDPAYHFDGDQDADLDLGVLFDVDGDPDADPSYQNDAVSCGSGRTTLLMEVKRVHVI
jgi:hypothetical protein